MTGKSNKQIPTLRMFNSDHHFVYKNDQQSNITINADSFSFQLITTLQPHNQRSLFFIEDI